MIDPLAAVQTVRVPFINWQYIYCWFASLFGARCAENPPTLPDVAPIVTDGIELATSSVGGVVDTVNQAGGGFWSWLWPFAETGSGVSGSATGMADTGWLSSIPAPIAHAFETVVSVVGPVVSFLWDIVSVISYTFSGLLFSALVVVLVLFVLLRIREWSRYGVLPPRGPAAVQGRSKWQALLDAAMAPDPRRWKEAVLAADDMLGSLLYALGYQGATTADRLRSVPEGAFVTLPQAWEAHRVRNFTAQRASNFILTQREAFRVMKLYEQVFEEFDFI